MKNRTSLLLALTLGIATFASADELDTLIHKLRGTPQAKESPTPASEEARRREVLSRLRVATSSTDAPAPASEERPSQADILQETLTEEPAVTKDESIVPIGSQPSHSADKLLKVAVPEGETNTFPAESRTFRLQDGTLKVVVPETLAPASADVPQDSEPAPIITSPLPVPVSPASD